MYTRCPECHTVHPVNASVLAKAEGKVKCGKCSKVFNALKAAFDTWPEAGDQPAENGGGIDSPPALSANIELSDKPPESEPDMSPEPSPADEPAPSSAAQPEAPPDPAPDDTAPEPVLPDALIHSARSARIDDRWWTAGAAILVLATAINALTLGGNPFEQPFLSRILEPLGLGGPAARTGFSDVSSIHLISRDMRGHPAYVNALILSATIVNRAPEAQPYPILEVVLTNNRSRPVASRRFRPEEYLAQDADLMAGMTPEAMLAISLELFDPGPEAVGFELNFLPSGGR
jgi:predicted Zn finger-like uncharacterized protein